MELIKSAVTEENGKRVVQCRFGAVSARGIPQHAEICVEVDPSGYPLLAESLREALILVRDAISGEIQRLADAAGRRR